MRFIIIISWLYECVYMPKFMLAGHIISCEDRVKILVDEIAPVR